MGFTVDNDAQIYINGILISPSNVTTRIYEYRNVYTDLNSIDPNHFDNNTFNFFKHEGCPYNDDLILNGIFTNVWHAGDNQLAVCVYDDGGTAFFDDQISLNVPITGTNSTVAGAANSPPLTFAGWNQFITLSNGSASVQLNGLVVDDGLPGTGAASATWTNIGGPGPVVFSPAIASFTNYNIINAMATFTVAGIYTNILVANDGALSATSSVYIIVSQDYTNSGYIPAPAVILTAPINGSYYLVGDTIPLAATASASVGTVTQVQFYANSSTVSHELVGRAIASPFAVNWNNLVPGNYTLTAEATDNGGRIGYSTNQVSVLITAITNHPPVAVNDQVTVPANSANNLIYALANDSDADNDPLTISSLSSRGVTSSSITTYNGGTATIINNGVAINYMPPPGVQGGDGFTYYISDGRGGTAKAGITINIYASATPSVILIPASGITNAGAFDPLIAIVSPSQNIAKVDFYQGTTFLGTTNYGPGGVYTLNWTAVFNPCGCGFTAQATDVFGQINTSA